MPDYRFEFVVQDITPGQARKLMREIIAAAVKKGEISIDGPGFEEVEEKKKRNRGE